MAQGCDPQPLPLAPSHAMARFHIRLAQIRQDRALPAVSKKRCCRSLINFCHRLTSDQAKMAAPKRSRSASPHVAAVTYRCSVSMLSDDLSGFAVVIVEGSPMMKQQFLGLKLHLRIAVRADKPSGTMTFVLW